MSERKQSFSCERPKSNSSKHNNREHKPKYLIERDPNFDGNFYQRYNHYENDKQYLEYAKEIYLKKHGQKMQKIQSETGMIWESIITLKKEQGEKEMLDLFKKLNGKYGGHEVLEVSVHRDEGHFVDKNGLEYYPNKHIFYDEESKSWHLDRKFKEPAPAMETVYNYHAHVKFTMMEQESCKTPQMAKRHWSDRHEVVAKELGLIHAPGETRFDKKDINQVKAEHHENRGQNAKTAKLTRKNDKLKEKVKSLESKLESKGKVSQKDLIDLKEEFRKEMILSELYYTKYDYQALNKLFEDAKELNKTKDLDIVDLQTQVAKLSEGKTNYVAKIEALETKVEEQSKSIVNKEAQIVADATLIEEKEQKIKILEVAAKNLKPTIEQIQHTEFEINGKVTTAGKIVKELKATVKDQAEEIGLLQKTVDYFKSMVKNLLTSKLTKLTEEPKEPKKEVDIKQIDSKFDKMLTEAKDLTGDLKFATENLNSDLWEDAPSP